MLNDPLTSELKKVIHATAPKSKWIFFMQDIFWWGLFVVFIILGSLAFSLILFFIINTHGQYDHLVHISRMFYFLSSFPYVWMLIFISFLSLAFVYVKYTRNAYKCSYFSIILTSILLSIFFGFILYLLKFASFTDHFLRENMRGYNHMMPHMQEMWENCERDR